MQCRNMRYSIDSFLMGDPSSFLEFRKPAPIVFYEDKCAACHGLQGDGRGTVKDLNPSPPDFTDRHMMEEMTGGEIFWKITTGKGPMPSYKKELTEKERWDLVNYIKSLAKPK